MSKIDEGIKDSTADIEMGFKDYKDKDKDQKCGTDKD